MQIPTWDGRLFDLEKAAESKAYCDEVKGTLAEHGVEITELSTHLQGQLVAVHPAYDAGFDGFARAGGARQPEGAPGMGGGADAARRRKASRNLGLDAHVTFSGALAWPYLYPWPQRPAGPDRDRLRRAGASAGGRSSTPSTSSGVDVCYEIHPGEDLLDGATFEMFLERGRQPSALLHQLRPQSHFVLQQLDYLGFIDIYHERIKAFHVKDAEFNPTGRQGVYSRLPALGRPRRPLPLARRRPGRLRRHLLQARRSYDYDGWAVLEWECCLKHPEDGAREGAEFIAAHIIRVTETRLRRLRRPGRRRGGEPAHARHRLREGGMAIEGKGDGKLGRRLRLGMVGGGQGAFIGAVHRIAARLDDHYELVAGALSSRSGARQGVGAPSSASRPSAPTPTSRRWRRRRRARDDGIEAVAIVTPNHLHHPAAKAFLEAGIHVICDKPLTTTLDDARRPGRGGRAQPARVFVPDPQLHRLPDGAAGARAGARRASSARSAWCRSSTRRTG